MSAQRRAAESRESSDELLRFYGRWVQGLIPLCDREGRHRHAGTPCSHPGKTPVRAGWQRAWDRADSSVEERARLAREAAEHWKGGGNVGLALPPRVLVLDVDTREGAARIAERLPGSPMQRSGRGAHFFVRVDEDVRNLVAVELEPGLRVDLRGHGAQVVAWPSIHASGAKYAWERPLPPSRSELPPLPEEWRAAIECRCALRDELPAQAATAGRVSEGQRNVSLTREAGRLRRLGLSEGVIRAALSQINRERCSPSLGENEVAAIAHSVARYEPGPIGQADAPSTTADTNTSEKGLRFVSLGELLSEPPSDVQWLVEERLPAGGISLLAGKPKSGKSTLARALALAVARGEPFLGWATAQGAVAYIALEDKRDELRAHLQALGATGGEPLWLFAGMAPSDSVQQLREYALRERPALIVVDTVFRFARVRDANDYAGVTAALEPLLSIARDTGAHVLLIGHAKKGEAQGGDAILGSTAIFGTVDTALILKRGEHRRTLSSIQRYGMDLPETVIELDEARRPVASGTRQEADERAAEEEILAILGDRHEGLSEKDILEQCSSGKTGTRRKALRSLVASGRVRRNGTGVRGDAYAYSAEIGRPEHSDSRSLVPAIYGAQRNEKRASALTARVPEDNSRSRTNDLEAQPLKAEEHLL